MRKRGSLQTTAASGLACTHMPRYVYFIPVPAVPVRWRISCTSNHTHTHTSTYTQSHIFTHL